jgi:FkbM family methyltransferase
LSRIARFIKKSAEEKRITIRYFVRQALSKLPFVPNRVRFTVGPGQELPLWWSYICHVDRPDRSFTAYWGDDGGELRFLWQFLEPGMVFFDVGAYHGIFSALAAVKLSSSGQVVAFEPSPRERRRFQLHVRMNRLRRVLLEPYAVSARCGSMKFFTVEGGFASMNSLKLPEVPVPVHEITAEVISVDEYLAPRKHLGMDIMKIDVEGGELEAFRGAQQTFRCLRPVIICEVLDYVTRPWGYPARDIIRCLCEEDYVWFDFHADGRISPHEIRNEYPDIRNYLAVPREKLPLVSRWRRE